MGAKGKDEAFATDILPTVNSPACRMRESAVGNGVFGLSTGHKCPNRTRKCHRLNKCGTSLGRMTIKELS